jgi:hypothetical protein
MVRWLAVEALMSDDRPRYQQHTSNPKPTESKFSGCRRIEPVHHADSGSKESAIAHSE